MKNLQSKIAVIFIVLFCSLNIFAQSLNDYIDVVYLKNGSIIKGIIVEQVPGKSLKIQTSDGSQFVYQIAEVEKFTRELKPEATTTTATSTTTTKTEAVKKEPKPFYSKQKGYFGGVELLISGSPGLRVINGYKFGRFGYLGLAVGLEANNINSYDLTSSYRPYMSMWGNHQPYATLNIVYGGDILKKRITPYYQVEVGYGFNLNGRSDRYYSYYDNGALYEYYYQQRNIGGPMGGAVFGVKFNTNKKVNFKLGLNARWFSNISDPANDGLYAGPYNNGSGFDLGGAMGIRFGIGF